MAGDRDPATRPDPQERGAGKHLCLPLCRACRYPAFVRRVIGPIRWAALFGDPEDIYKTDAKVKALVDDPNLRTCLDMAREQQIKSLDRTARPWWRKSGAGVVQR